MWLSAYRVRLNQVVAISRRTNQLETDAAAGGRRSAGEPFGGARANQLP